LQAKRKQKSKAANSASNNNSLLRASPFATFFFWQTLFYGCKSARPSFLFFASASADKKQTSL